MFNFLKVFCCCPRGRCDHWIGDPGPGVQLVVHGGLGEPGAVLGLLQLLLGLPELGQVEGGDLLGLLDLLLVALNLRWE